MILRCYFGWRWSFSLIKGARKKEKKKKSNFESHWHRKKQCCGTRIPKKQWCNTMVEMLTQIRFTCTCIWNLWWTEKALGCSVSEKETYFNGFNGFRPLERDFTGFKCCWRRFYEVEEKNFYVTKILNNFYTIYTLIRNYPVD